MCRLKIRAFSITNELIDLMRRNESILEMLTERQRQMRYRSNDQQIETIASIETFRRALVDCAASTKCDVDRIWAFGPQRARFNILINAIDDFKSNIWRDCKCFGFHVCITHCVPR